MNTPTNCQLRNVVNFPSQWPDTLPQPTGSVKTYVFDSYQKQNDFVSFLKKNLNNVPLNTSQDNNGMYMVSLTNLTTGCPTSATNDE